MAVTVKRINVSTADSGKRERKTKSSPPSTEREDEPAKEVPNCCLVELYSLRAYTRYRYLSVASRRIAIY
eukprot:1279408-Amorphochlora_amoeboformis.AAC.1